MRLALLLLATLCTAAPVPSHTDCQNTHEDAACEQWAASGECDKNVGFMKKACAKSCRSCGWEDTTCSDPVGTPAKGQPGDITATFERAAAFMELAPHVLSSPNTAKPGPWVLRFDNFISDEEADAFISTTDHHFKRSLAGDMVSPVRTSKQAWCQYGIAPECVDHPLVNRVHERVVNITGVPKENAEFFQVLRYEPGQFYKTHHDQNTDPDSLAGVRLFTFFIYLQTPGSGGATNFPQLNITVPPTRGSAVMWPNVLDHDPRRADMRTEHQALPPTEGIKLSANLWLHQYDFRGPNVHGCDMGKRVRQNADSRQIHGGAGSGAGQIPREVVSAFDGEDMRVEL
jgi:hypothetical protein